MQYIGQNNDELRHRWNNYKDNNRKSLRGENHKQEGLFCHIFIFLISAFYFLLLLLLLFFFCKLANDDKT